MTTGYVRYATYLELLGGVVMLTIFCHLARRQGSLRRVLIATPWIILLAQSFIAVETRLPVRMEHAPDSLPRAQSLLKPSRDNLFSDHSFMKFVPDRERKLFENVDVWIESNFITNGLETLLKPDAPIILVCFPYYFETPARTREIRQKPSTMPSNKKIYTLAFTKDLSPSLDHAQFSRTRNG